MSEVLAQFSDLTTEGKLNQIFAQLLANQELTVALQDQITELTGVVAAVKAKQDVQGQQLADLQTSVDAEQVQVQNALGLLTQNNPDLAAAIAVLQGVDANLGTASDTIGTIKADVESTIPDAP